jgi:hypothetical protein
MTNTQSISIEFASSSYSDSDSALTDNEIENFERLCQEALEEEFPGVEISVGSANVLASSYHASGFDPLDSPSCSLDHAAEESARDTVELIWNSEKWAE